MPSVWVSVSHIGASLKVFNDTQKVKIATDHDNIHPRHVCYPWTPCNSEALAENQEAITETIGGLRGDQTDTVSAWSVRRTEHLPVACLSRIKPVKGKRKSDPLLVYIQERHKK